MRQLSPTELQLCRMQGELFEASAREASCGSATFVRRFAGSGVAKAFDSGAILYSSSTNRRLLAEIEDEYGPAQRGGAVFGTEELFWMGYLYRYWCCLLGCTSAEAYAVASATELLRVYPAYHTLDPAMAIERLYEARGLPLPAAPGEEADADAIERGVATLRRWRGNPEYRYYISPFGQG